MSRAEWPSAPLGDVATLQRGYDLPIQDRRPGSVPIFAANGPVGFHEISKEPGPGVVTGRSGSIGKVHFTDSPFWPLNTSLFVKDFHGNEPRWVYWLLKSMDLARFHEGTGVPTLNRNVIHNVKVGVPPIEEQRRIAAVLDKADELRAKRRNALANLGTLTESIFIEMFGDPLSKASDTHLTTLGSAVDFHGGGTPSRAVAAYYRGAICWATSKDMKQRFLDDTQEHITQAAIDASATKLVAPGTVLVVVKSKVLAHSLPVALARVPTCFGQDLKGLSPRPGWDSTFVAESVRSARRWLLSRARGVNTEGLTLEHLRSMPIVNASPETQTAFARRVSLVVGLEDKTLSHVAHLDDLFYSLQQRAFQGAL